MDGKDPRIRDKNRLPSKAAQEQYPLDKYPCATCAKGLLPFLVDNTSELNWEHHHGHGGRHGCPRFNDGEHLGSKPREGTAVSKWKIVLGRYVLKDPDNPWPPTGDGSPE